MTTTHSRPDRLETLSEIGRTLASTLDLHTLYDAIFTQIARVMNASQFFIALHRPGSDSIEMPYLQEEGKLSLDYLLPYGDNTTSIIIDSGITLRYGTAEEYRHFEMESGLTPYIVGEHDSESGIFVPLRTENRTIGALSVQTLERRAYSHEDEQMLSIIAAQAAVAIENARLYEESRRAEQRTHALLRVARSLSGTLDLASVLDAILDSLRDVLPFTYADILLPNHSTQTLAIVGSVKPSGRHQGTTSDEVEHIPFGEGFRGAVFLSGEPSIRSESISSAGAESGTVRSIHSEMTVPLRSGGAVVGVLDIGREGKQAFAVEELGILTLFGSQAAIAIENARLFAEQRERVDELQVIQSIVRQLTPLHETEAIFSLMDAELKQLIDFHACHLYLLDDATQTLIPAGSDGATPPLSIDHGFAGWIARHGESDIIVDTQRDERPSHITGTPDRVESMVGVPLIYEDRVRGVITLSRLGSDAFDRDDLRLLEIIAAQVAIACDRARLYQQLRTEALTDPLVHLWNRRFLLERYREEVARAQRTLRPLLTIMLDIDKFKRVNDTYGHDAGDAVLQEVAALIRTQVRAEDIVARWGGEEFSILLPETQLPEGVAIAERLRRTIASHRLGATAITVSMGIAVWQASDGQEEFFGRADQAMYQVKEAGGNGTCLIEDNAFTLLPAEL